MLSLIIFVLITICCCLVLVNTDSFLSLVGIVIGVVMIFSIVGIQLLSQGFLSSKQEAYKAIMYKAQTTDCRDEYGFLNKEIVDEIQAWNMDVSKNKAYRKNVLIQGFAASAYDDLELIDINEMKYKTFEP